MSIITERIEVERTMQDVVDRAVVVARKDGIVRNFSLCDEQLHLLQELLVKEGLQIDRMESPPMILYIKPLHSYCNCFLLYPRYINKNYVCEYHRAFRALGPQYWINEERIRFDSTHPYCKEMIIPRGWDVSITAPKTDETIQYLLNTYGESGDTNRERLQQQYCLQ